MGWDGGKERREKENGVGSLGEGKRRERANWWWMAMDLGEPNLPYPRAVAHAPVGGGCEGFEDASGAKDSVLISALWGD